MRIAVNRRLLLCWWGQGTPCSVKVAGFIQGVDISQFAIGLVINQPYPAEIPVPVADMKSLEMTEP